MKLMRWLLFPFSLFYGGIIFLRNRLYDRGWLFSSRGKLPTLVVGNLSLGGTGKTPMSEYLIRLFSENNRRPSFLSRGYGRKTKGYIRVTEQHDATQIGDEPKQIAVKFPDIPTAVCEDRLLGIQCLSEEQSDIDVVILDDAFQHRRLVPDISILLTHFQRPFFKDHLLPVGTLRDNRREKQRADIIIVTKCPDQLNQKEREEWIRAIDPSPEQKVFFTTLRYGRPTPVFSGQRAWHDDAKVIGFCGIAHPKVFQKHLSENYCLKKFKSYPDHHSFTVADSVEWHKVLNTFADREKALLTTEKDAAKIKTVKGWDLPVFFLPIEIQFLDSEEKFCEWVMKATTEKK